MPRTMPSSVAAFVPRQTTGRRRSSAALLAILLAVVASVAMYHFYGKHDPVPGWIQVPPRHKIQVSRYRPRGSDEHLGPQYFLQLHSDQPAALAISHIMGSISDYSWEPEGPRKLTSQQLRERMFWPQWVREIRHGAAESEEAYFGAASASDSDKLYVYVFPDAEGSIIEIVQLAEPPLSEINLAR